LCCWRTARWQPSPGGVVAAQTQQAADHLQNVGPVLGHAGASPNHRNLPATPLMLQGLAALMGYFLPLIQYNDVGSQGNSIIFDRSSLTENNLYRAGFTCRCGSWKKTATIHSFAFRVMRRVPSICNKGWLWRSCVRAALHGLGSYTPRNSNNCNNLVHIGTTIISSPTDK
jgi:hypothetical protein